MKAIGILSAAAILAGLPAAAMAQSGSLRVYTCDTTISSQPPLRIEDESSLAGAILEDPSLITLPNGMKAVQFSVRYAKRLLPSSRILKVRYTVDWTDDCGRRVTNGARTVDGLILNPGQYQTVQSTAMHADAARAVLRIYVSDN